MSDHRAGGPAGGAGGFWAWYTVAVFLLLYIFSFIDRGIIGMMVQPIERDLGITDVQISLLSGPAFSLFYVLCGLPIGWLVDRFSRRWLTVVGVTIWGLATCFCGVAGGLVQLLVGRMGVGVGESVLTPTAHSLIAEQFPPKRLSLALSVYTMGAVIGGGIALAVGGIVVHAVSHSPPVALPLVGAVRAWQLAFLLVGAPTVILAPIALTVRERRPPKPAPVAATSEPAAPAGPSFFRSHWRIAWGVPLGFGMTNIIVGGLVGWSPTYMIRSFGWDPAEIGITFGLISLTAGVVGQLGGAAVVDWLYARGVKDAHTRYHIGGLLVTAPALVISLLSGNAIAFVAAWALFQCVTYPYIGYAAAALQLFAPSHVRGRASAIFLAIITVLGSIGPIAVAMVTEHVLGDKARLGQAMAAIVCVAAPLAIVVLSQVGRAMRQAHVEREAAQPVFAAALASEPAGLG